MARVCVWQCRASCLGTLARRALENREVLQNWTTTDLPRSTIGKRRQAHLQTQLSSNPAFSGFRPCVEETRWSHSILLLRSIHGAPNTQYCSGTRYSPCILRHPFTLFNPKPCFRRPPTRACLRMTACMSSSWPGEIQGHHQFVSDHRLRLHRFLDMRVYRYW